VTCFAAPTSRSYDEQNANEHTMPETAEIYDELIRCKTPPELVRGYFLVSMLRERIDEETARRTAPVSRIEIIHSNCRRGDLARITAFLRGWASSFRLQSGTSLRVPDLANL